MTYSWIRTELRPPQGRIVLNQPEKRNPLSMAAVAEVTSAVRAFEQDPAVRAIVITGAGDVFSAGAYLRGFLEWTPLQDRAAYHNWVELHRLATHLTKPLIGLVNGLALGGACVLVGLCDVAIASDHAQFAYIEIERGMGFGPAMVALLRSVPLKKVLDLAYSARRIDAFEAERLGIVSRVVPHDRLEAAGEEMVADLARKSAVAIAFTREAYYALQDLPYLTALERSRDLGVLSRLSADAREGMVAFLEKRPPVWVGR